MQHISEIYIPSPQQNLFVGGRIADASYRESFEASSQFQGLEEGTNRYDILLLIKKVGKSFGFTPRMIQLLDYYMAYTRDCDWEEGSRPIIYQSLHRTALDLAVSERQIQKLERSLCDLGALTWNDSGNHRRYGQRDPRTGRILYAFGVDLSPLAALKPALEQRLAEKEAHDAQWMETKRQISWYRSQIRGQVLELEEQGRGVEARDFGTRYHAVAVQIRSHMSLEQLTAILGEHKRLHTDISDLMPPPTSKAEGITQRPLNPKETSICSPKDELKFAHYKSTTQQSSNKLDTRNPSGICLQKRVADGPGPQSLAHSAGVHHVTLAMATAAAGQRVQAYLPNDPSWPDLVEAAYRARGELQISQRSWAKACTLLGRTGATLCILITDRAKDRPIQPIRNTAAYFNGMLNHAIERQLQVHKTVFGILSPKNLHKKRKSTLRVDHRQNGYNSLVSPHTPRY